MMVLKDLLLVRPDMRVVLMSATLNAQLFSEYFYDAPVIHIPGIKQLWPLNYTLQLTVVIELYLIVNSCDRSLHHNRRMP